MDGFHGGALNNLIFNNITRSVIAGTTTELLLARRKQQLFKNANAFKIARARDCNGGKVCVKYRRAGGRYHVRARRPIADKIQLAASSARHRVR